MAKPNSGALFKNDRKEKDAHPDYTGSLNVNGVDYWLSAWINESDSGKKYFGLKVKPKEEKATPAPPKDFDDDLPF